MNFMNQKRGLYAKPHRAQDGHREEIWGNAEFNEKGPFWSHHTNNAQYNCILRHEIHINNLYCNAESNWTM